MQKLGIEGLELIPEFKRLYPRDWMASQLLGVTGTDNQGLSGLEYSLDKYLHGRDGERKMTKDALGDAIRMRETKPTVPGSNVRLTLDNAIQDRAEQVLAAVGEVHKPKGATAIVMDPRDGSILALANWPQVNANAPGDAPDYARQDRAIGATYEPGSTFKAFTVAGALEQGEVTPDTTFNLPPTIKVADREIGESHPVGYRSLTTAGILKESSNVGAIMIGQRLGATDFDKWVRRFGFGEPTGIDLPGEERGHRAQRQGLLGRVDGQPADRPGHRGDADADGDRLRRDRQRRHPAAAAHRRGRRRAAAKKPQGHRIISEATAASLRRMLEGVFGPGGTASGASIDGYVMAGKTGTAEKPDENGGYSKTKFVSSFVGFAPARRPKLLVAVMVDEPQGDIYGGTVAAPAFREIMSFALNYLKIPPR